jgi:hypothetical protein
VRDAHVRGKPGDAGVAFALLAPAIRGRAQAVVAGPSTRLKRRATRQLREAAHQAPRDKRERYERIGIGPSRISYE